MYLGRIVEQNDAETLFRDPRHPYTKALLASVLTPEPKLGIPETGLGDTMPDPTNVPPGCRFHPRCAERMEMCAKVEPRPLPQDDGGRVECHLYGR